VVSLPPCKTEPARGAINSTEGDAWTAAAMAIAAIAPKNRFATFARAIAADTLEWSFEESNNLSDHYYAPDHLKAFGTISEGAPELGKKFFDYYSAVFAAGALTEREKALIALAVAHTVQCPYCIDAYTTDCLQKGSDLEQMTEAVHVACAIRGGASLVHGMQMKEHAAKVGM
jgi:alkylhydroperoxidase/carboxymuconolactone decarboxylase family protein